MFNVLNWLSLSHSFIVFVNFPNCHCHIYVYLEIIFLGMLSKWSLVGCLQGLNIIFNQLDFSQWLNFSQWTPNRRTRNLLPWVRKYIVFCSHNPRFGFFVHPLEQGKPYQPLVPIFLTCLVLIYPDHFGQLISQFQITVYNIDPFLDISKANISLDCPQSVQLTLCKFLIGSLPNSGHCYIPGVHFLNTCIEDKYLFTLLHINVYRGINVSTNIFANISVNEPDNILKQLLSLKK